MFGGAGFLLDGLPVLVEAEPSDSSALEDGGVLDTRTLHSVQAAMKELESTLRAQGSRVRITLPDANLLHVGLGMGTAVTLGVLRAIAEAAAVDLPNEVLVACSRRGGASGIGSAAFFEGGFIVDVGHKAPKTGRHFLPSSARRPPAAAPALRVGSGHDDWWISLYLPAGRRTDGANEVEFFGANTPIDSEAVGALLAEVYHGLVPAYLEHDLEAFAASLEAIQNLGFKEREIAHQPPGVRLLITALNSIPRTGAGMSSLGPLVFAISDSPTPPPAELTPHLEVRSLGAYRIRSRGFEVLERR
jgi:beta-ribofuranosylaminobenzene 5'-phosphate synthase